MSFRSIFRYNGPVRAVVFDWAGTIVDYGCFSPAGVFTEVFRQEGLTVSVEEARRPMGIHKRTHIAQMLADQSISARWLSVKGRPSNDDDISRMYANFTPLQLSAVKDYSKLIPGLLPVVEGLRHRSIKIGTCTGFATEVLDVLVKEAEKQGFIADSHVAADEVVDSRPAPDMIWRNAEKLRVYPPSAIVKGNNVGLSEEDVAKVPREQLSRLCAEAAEKLRSAGAHFVIESVADLLPVIDEIEDVLRTYDEALEAVN